MGFVDDSYFKYFFFSNHTYSIRVIRAPSAVSRCSIFWYTIGKSIDELLKNNKVPKNIRKEKIIELLKLVGLDKQYIDKYPRELSGGQCQRAAIAKAISCEPKILICDEVTSALDVSVQGQVISLLKELKEKKNMTYIFI